MEGRLEIGIDFEVEVDTDKLNHRADLLGCKNTISFIRSLVVARPFTMLHDMDFSGFSAVGLLSSGLSLRCLPCFKLPLPARFGFGFGFGLGLGLQSSGFHTGVPG